MTGRPLMDKGDFQFNLDGGMSQGPKHIVKPARDPIAQVPEDPQIIALLQRCLCRAKLGEGCWEITSVTGKVTTVSLGATLGMWTHVCENLLKAAMLEDNVGP